MKLEKKTIIAIIAIVLMIIAGIVVVSLWGFNKELRFEQGQKIDIYVEQQVDKTQVKNIANEVLGMHNMVQTIEIYQDMVTIKARNISEEQKITIINKMKEIYEFEQTADVTNIDTVPTTRIRDMYKQYIIPGLISGVLVVAYLIIAYRKKGMLKVLTKAVCIPVAVELVFLSWIAIVRIPVGRFTPALMLLIYVASVWYTMKEIEK